MGLSGSKSQSDAANGADAKGRSKGDEPRRRRSQRDADNWAQHNPVLQETQRPDARNLFVPEEVEEVWVAQEGGGFALSPAGPDTQ